MVRLRSYGAEGTGVGVRERTMGCPRVQPGCREVVGGRWFKRRSDDARWWRVAVVRLRSCGAKGTVGGVREGTMGCLGRACV